MHVPDGQSESFVQVSPLLEELLEDVCPPEEELDGVMHEGFNGCLQLYVLSKQQKVSEQLKEKCST